MGYVYVGPQFRDSPLRSFHFYREIPEPYASNPIYVRLFVQPSDLDKARVQVSTTGTLLNTCYKRAVLLHKNQKEG